MTVEQFIADLNDLKQLVWFEESGHEPFADEPAKFNAAMAEFVAPAMSSEPLEHAT